MNFIEQCIHRFVSLPSAIFQAASGIFPKLSYHSEQSAVPSVTESLASL